MRSAVVIGAGFYGIILALYLSKIKKIPKIVLLEKNEKPFGHASFWNQIRIHNGYHYPRSFTTACRSHSSFRKFISDFNDCIDTSIDSYYGIARYGSKTSTSRFEYFCKNLSLPLSDSPLRIQKLFNDNLVQKIYKVKEYLFNPFLLKEILCNALDNSDIEVLYDSRVINIDSHSNGESVCDYLCSSKTISITTDLIVNCTYSGINHIVGKSYNQLVHQIAEIVYLDTPDELNDLNFTLIDGPFFSLASIPSTRFSSLTHVRYTPTIKWNDQVLIDPYTRLSTFPKNTSSKQMLQDSSRYLPLISQSSYLGSRFELKSFVNCTAYNDSRPIYIRKDFRNAHVYSVLGSKIDNIYDAISFFDSVFPEL